MIEVETVTEKLNVKFKRRTICRICGERFEHCSAPAEHERQYQQFVPNPKCWSIRTAKRFNSQSKLYTTPEKEFTV